MRKEILASVIIPVHNSEKYIGDCLESVLKQDFKNFEVIVVDNNSTDKTKEIIFEFAKKHKNLKYIFEPKIGRGVARNTGEKMSQGKIILMTDSDCIVPENWIRNMAEPILAKKTQAVQGSEKGLGNDFWSQQIARRIEEKEKRYETGKETIKIDTKNFAITRELLEEIGNTSRWFVSGNDTDLMIRLLKRNIIPSFEKNIKVKHHNPNSLIKFFKKQFWRAFWCHRITKTHLLFLRRTNFLEETEQSRQPILESLKNLKSVVFDKGLRYLFFNLTSTLAWQLGLFYSKYRPFEIANSLNNKKFNDTITAIVPIRNRYDFRVINCLKSLRNQTYDRSLINIILVDYGSDEQYRKSFEDLCRTFDARGIWTGRIKEVWNKSKCLNIGLRRINTKYFIVADVDVVFEANYLETCVELAEMSSGSVGFYPKIFDCSKGVINDQTDVVADFEKIFQQTIYRGDIFKNDFPYGVGILFAQTKVVKEIGGYDEFYKCWGSEDKDLLNRLRTLGANILNIANHTRVIHQWHSKNEGLEIGSELVERIKLNQRYCENNFSIIRNQSRKPIVFLKKLPGTIWGITTFFNPVGYKNKSENFRAFRGAIKKQGLKLIVVELTFNSSTFELSPKDAEILVQLKGDKKNIMWQKEAMLNVGLQHLPEDCDKVVWLDGDIIFTNDNWVNETSSLLEKYKVVQPFRNAIRVGPNIKKVSRYSVVKLRREFWDGSQSFAAVWPSKGNEMVAGNFFRYAPGYACAVRRSVIDKIKFYDSAILGGADSIMIRAFCGWRHFTHSTGLSKSLIKKQDFWSFKTYQEVQGSLHFTTGDIVHLWHGNRKDRKYGIRDNILKQHAFDPDFDIVKNNSGILEWATEKTQLEEEVKEYFYVRSESETRYRDTPYLIKTVRKMTKVSKKEDKKNTSVFKIMKKQGQFILQQSLKGKIRKLNKQYTYFLGLCGQRIRSNNEDLYFKLKKYFPDRN